MWTTNQFVVVRGECCFLYIFRVCLRIYHRTALNKATGNIFVSSELPTKWRVNVGEGEEDRKNNDHNNENSGKELHYPTVVDFIPFNPCPIPKCTTGLIAFKRVDGLHPIKIQFDFLSPTRLEHIRKSFYKSKYRETKGLENELLAIRDRLKFKKKETSGVWPRLCRSILATRLNLLQPQN